MKTKLLVIGFLVVSIVLLINEIENDMLHDLATERMKEKTEEWSM